jgi:hypothetical protein
LTAAPLYELRLRTPRLELRLGNSDELAALARLAQEGIHRPKEMPFAMAWTDRRDEEGFVESFVESHEAALRDWRPEKWSLNLLVFVGGRPGRDLGPRRLPSAFRPQRSFLSAAPIDWCFVSTGS